MNLNYQYLETPIGKLLVVGKEGALSEILFENDGRPAEPASSWRESDAGLETILQQLREYFSGERSDFNLELCADGTEFQKRVWQELVHIPHGDTISYGELAARLGKPTASRAVGAANGRNPIPVVVPCHRVIGSNGSLTGYAGGMATKEWLLRHEGALQHA